MSVRLKYYAERVIAGLAAAALIITAVFVLAGNEIALRKRTAEICESLSDCAPLVININTASVRELQKLNGVGKITAAAIIDYRDEHGAFGSADELTNVRGIGSATLEKLRPFVTV